MNAAQPDPDIPITFPSGVNAYRWAMEVLSGSGDAAGMYGAIIAKSGTPWRKRADEAKRPRPIPREDVRDLAHTISAVEVQCVPDVARTILRAVYVAHTFPGVRSVAIQVVAQDVLHEGMRPTVMGKLPQIVDLAMDAERRYRMKGQKTPQAAFARVVGVSRQGVTQGGWPEVIAAVRKRVRVLLDQAESALEDALRVRGVVS